MTNDLISRSALKKALHNFFGGKVIDEPTYILRDVFCHIDNAPTVEQKYYERIVAQINPVIEARPQGEWIVDENNDFSIFKKCSNCGEGAEWLDGGSQFLSNYCPACGADMRKEKKNEHL